MKKVQCKNIVFGEGLPKICVPIVGKTEDEILTQAKTIVERADVCGISVVEFRGDFYENITDEARTIDLLSKLQSVLGNLVLLFTIRSANEGGEKVDWKNTSLYEINLAVVKSGIPDMVDVELFSGDETIKTILGEAEKSKVKIIMSNHDFNTTPEVSEMVARLKKMQTLGCDIAKIAVMPQSKEHLLWLLEATNRCKEEDVTPLVTISMGATGAISRVAGEIFGSAMSFATVEHASAPGQIPAESLNHLLQEIHSFCV